MPNSKQAAKRMKQNEKALEAYERSLEITRAGHGSLDLNELELRVARARLDTDIKNRSYAGVLETSRNLRRKEL